ncbi:MAG TPA: ABC transporter ATP-binding protein [Gemmataceae bacterium]|nr:ABC transporter ATP-binding protein [Gemmataceae bacterium]
MTSPWDAVAWPADRLGEALRHVAVSPPAGSAPAPPDGHDDAALSRWVEAGAAQVGLEAEAVEAPYGEVESLLRSSGPALLRLPGREPLFVVLLGSAGAALRLLAPDGAAVTRPAPALRDALCAPAEAEVGAAADRVVAGLGESAARRDRARAALLRELLAGRSVGGCWLLRAGGAAGLVARAREAGLVRLLALWLAAQGGELALWVLSWWLLGWLSLRGRLEPGWLAAWLMLLLSTVPCRLLTTWASGRLALGAGALLKRQLLLGALRLGPDEVRHQGAGQLLGRVLESQAIEALALGGGLGAMTGLLGLIAGALVLALGAGSLLHLLLLAGWLALAFGLAGRYFRLRRSWTDERLDLTDSLVERMVGHRTRLAQEPRDRWHEGDDDALAHYLERSRRLDGGLARLLGPLPRGWLLLGVLGLVPAFLHGEPALGPLAVGLGGVLLAYRGFRDLAEGIDKLTPAAIAWQRVRPFWQAAASPDPPAPPVIPASGPTGPLVEARDVSFGYRAGGAPVLRGVGLEVRRGDRLLLVGPSGGGKSTLAALVAGLRLPSAGLLLLGGLDFRTLGRDGWRRRVVLVPQFHDNHVLMGTLAFNLLMARGWPPRPEDVAEAERVCRALDLGPLLDRMPSGLLQQVGETGWQLSHGERGRLFLARALLQGAELVLLDETFAALDPHTLRRCLGFVMNEAPALMVIAHP